MAELIDVDSAQANILQVRCRGTQRFDVQASRQQSDGLWVARATSVPDDDAVPPPRPRTTRCAGWPTRSPR
jgi:Lon protease-like protein